MQDEHVKTEKPPILFVVPDDGESAVQTGDARIGSAVSFLNPHQFSEDLDRALRVLRRRLVCYWIVIFAWILGSSAFFSWLSPPAVRWEATAVLIALPLFALLRGVLKTEARIETYDEQRLASLRLKSGGDDLRVSDEEFYDSLKRQSEISKGSNRDDGSDKSFLSWVADGIKDRFGRNK